MRRSKTIDDYSKEELYDELQREKAVNSCLLKEIQDIKDIIRMLSNGKNTNQLNMTGSENIIVQNS